jgi:hypothetical protein
MLNGVPLERGCDAVIQLDPPYVRPADVLAALQHAVSPRTYDSSERFTPLASLTQFTQAFSGNRFRFRCPVGRVNPVMFDVDGDVSASSSGGTTLQFSIRLAYPALRYLASAVLLGWFAFAAWTLPHGIGFIPLAVVAVFFLNVWPAYVRNSRADLEGRLRELRAFLVSRIPP